MNENKAYLSGETDETERAEDRQSRACDQASPSVPYPPARDARGRWLPGNAGAVTNGLRATNLPPEMARLRVDLDAFIAGCLVDEGDAGDVSTRRKSLLEYRARIHRRIVQLDGAIELRGLFDKRGKLRVAWLQRLEGLINTGKAIDSLLGLERRAKRVPTPAEYLEGNV